MPSKKPNQRTRAYPEIASTFASQKGSGGSGDPVLKGPILKIPNFLERNLGSGFLTLKQEKDSEPYPEELSLETETPPGLWRIEAP